MKGTLKHEHRITAMLRGDLCACGEDAMEHSDSCEECATVLKSHRVRGQWFALPNGIGSDVGPFSSEEEALAWMDDPNA